MITLTEDQQKIIDILYKHTREVYVVGGAVRDALMGRDAHDIDLASDLMPDELRAIFPDSEVTGNVFPTVRVRRGHTVLEVSTFRCEVGCARGGQGAFTTVRTIEDDLARRDLTINAMAWNPRRSVLIDPHGGLQDIQNKIVRFVGDARARIQEDPLRALRALRFRSVFHGRYATDTLLTLGHSRTRQLVANISAYRVREELMKTMSSVKFAGEYVRDLHSLGFIDVDINDKDVQAGDSVSCSMPVCKFLTYMTACTVQDLPCVFNAGFKTDLKIYNALHEYRAMLSNQYALNEYQARVLATSFAPDVIDMILAHMTALVKAEHQAIDSQINIHTLAQFTGAVRFAKSENLKPVVNGHDIITALNIQPSKELGFIIDSLVGVILVNPELNERRMLLDIADVLYRFHCGR